MKATPQLEASIPTICLFSCTVVAESSEISLDLERKWVVFVLGFAMFVIEFWYQIFDNFVCVCD